MPAKTGAHSIGIGVPGAMWLNRNSGNSREQGNASSLETQAPDSAGTKIRI
jgi:hypothetical protein